MGSGWVAAYRIVPSGMELAIGEIRLFPTEEGQKPGRWSGDPASVPPGGPASSVLRKLATSSAIEKFDEIVDRWDEQAGGYVKAEMLKRFGLDRSASTVTARPGRHARDDLLLRHVGGRIRRAPAER